MTRLDNNTAQREYIAPTVLALIDPVAFGAALEDGRPVLYRFRRRAVYMLRVGSKVGRAGEVSSIQRYVCVPICWWDSVRPGFVGIYCVSFAVEMCVSECGPGMASPTFVL